MRMLMLMLMLMLRLEGRGLSYNHTRLVLMLRLGVRSVAGPELTGVHWLNIMNVRVRHLCSSLVAYHECQG